MQKNLRNIEILTIKYILHCQRVITKKVLVIAFLILFSLNNNRGIKIKIAKYLKVIAMEKNKMNFLLWFFK